MLTRCQSIMAYRCIFEVKYPLEMLAAHAEPQPQTPWWKISGCGPFLPPAHLLVEGDVASLVALRGSWDLDEVEVGGGGHGDVG